MLVSAFADRSDAVELEQATLEGVSYMFFAPHDPSTAIERVTFWLDDPSMSTAPSQVEVHPPYDFGGGGPFGRNGNGPTDAWDYDTSRLADGLHTMTVRVDLADGTEAVVDTVFYVANGRISARAATPEPVAEAAPMQLLRTVLATLAE